MRVLTRVILETSRGPSFESMHLGGNPLTLAVGDGGNDVSMLLWHLERLRTLTNLVRAKNLSAAFSDDRKSKYSVFSCHHVSSISVKAHNVNLDSFPYFRVIL